MIIFKKAIFRVFRILTGHVGIYGRIGKGNKFKRGVFVQENTVIGKYCYFGPSTMINNAEIGNYCSFAPGVKIGQANHSKDYITTFQGISGKMIGHSLWGKPAVIGNDVWCGANAVIMQNICVGDGAIIGANAVVTRDIPDYGIAVGVPARVIKYRFDEPIRGKIKESNWFLLDIDEAKAVISDLAGKYCVKM